MAERNSEPKPDRRPTPPETHVEEMDPVYKWIAAIGISVMVIIVGAMIVLTFIS